MVEKTKEKEKRKEKRKKEGKKKKKKSYTMGKRFSLINGVAICDNMDGPRGHYAKWNKSVRERQSRIISLICGIQKKIKLINIRNRLVVARGGGWG